MLHRYLTIFLLAIRHLIWTICHLNKQNFFLNLTKISFNLCIINTSSFGTLVEQSYIFPKYKEKRIFVAFENRKMHYFLSNCLRRCKMSWVKHYFQQVLHKFECYFLYLIKSSTLNEEFYFPCFLFLFYALTWLESIIFNLSLIKNLIKTRFFIFSSSTKHKLHLATLYLTLIDFENIFIFLHYFDLINFRF